MTGSRFLLDVDNTRLLIDCGLYQERELKIRNWDPFPVPPNSIDALLLTHAHLDHSGFLPKLVKDGFNGRVYCTNATARYNKIILLDSANIQVEDAEFKKKRHKREKRKGPYPEIPLYTSRRMSDHASPSSRQSNTKGEHLSCRRASTQVFTRCRTYPRCCNDKSNHTARQKQGIILFSRRRRSDGTNRSFAILLYSAKRTMYLSSQLMATEFMRVKIA